MAFRRPPLLRHDSPFMLVVGMTGVKMGDRLVQVGCADGGRLAAVASKVGLSGRAVAVVPDDASAGRVRKGAERAGVLVEIEIAPPTHLPLEDNAFDLAVIDETGGLLATMGADDRIAAVGEARRVVRPGGRVMVIGAAKRSGLGAMFTRAQSAPAFDPTPLLAADSFRAVRTLAERDGLIFIEALKPRS
jgi:ubiquinone/menaquinone biosynthesis C-methylase UbiE